MPYIPIGNPIVLPISGGSLIHIGGGSFPPFHIGGVLNPVPVGGFPAILLPPTHLSKPKITQIAGLVPLWDCDYSDCRATDKDYCYVNPVFADAYGNPSYTNDFNSFLIEFNPGLFLPSSGSISFNWTIQKLVNGIWTTVITISNNNYGNYVPLGSVPNHPTYTYLNVDWGRVYVDQGVGYYRVCANGIVLTTRGGKTATTVTSNLLPPAFTGSITGTSGNRTLTFSTDISGSMGTGTLSGTILEAGGGTLTGSINGIAITGGSIDSIDSVYTWLNDPTVAYISGWWMGLKFHGTIKFSKTRNTFKNGTMSIINDATSQSEILNCKCSDTFWLRKWDCVQAHGTVKFECWMDGKIGDINSDYTVFDLCGMNYYDSIRMRGFIGYEKTSYDRVDLEFQNGLIDPIRNKALQKFKFNSNLVPKYIHDRFKVYCLMANTILGSDYNMNNSDYFIKRKTFVMESGYEPEYLDKNFNDRSMQWRARQSSVSIELGEGVQSVIKTIC